MTSCIPRFRTSYLVATRTATTILKDRVRQRVTTTDGQDRMISQIPQPLHDFQAADQS